MCIYIYRATWHTYLLRIQNIYTYIHVCLLPSSLGPRHCADGQQEGTAATQSRQVRLRQWLAETSDLGC